MEIVFFYDMGDIRINGDNNQVYSRLKKSRINSEDKTTHNHSTVKWVGIASLIVAILGLLLRYWSSIVGLFK